MHKEWPDDYKLLQEGAVNTEKPIKVYMNDDPVV